MPIHEKNGSYILSGKEWDQFKQLHEKIKNKQSISELLNEINPEYFEIILNGKRRYNDIDYLTPVHVAAKYGNLDALKILSSVGAAFDEFSQPYGDSALHFAARYNHLEVIDYLIKEKHLAVDTPAKVIETNAYYVKNPTPLFDCAVRGCLEAAEKLISYGANVNYQTSKGITALHYACHFGFAWSDAVTVGKLVKILLQNGADPTLKASFSIYSTDATAVEMISNNINCMIIKQIIDKHCKKEASAVAELARQRSSLHDTIKPRMVILPPTETQDVTVSKLKQP